VGSGRGHAPWWRARGEAREVAGDLAAGGVDEEEQAGARLRRALGDDVAQAGGAADLILLAQADHLGGQGLDHLGGEQLVGAPGDEGDDQGSRQGERADVGQRHSERRGG